MSNEQLILAFFPDEASADGAALVLQDSKVGFGDAIEILVLDSTGKVGLARLEPSASGRGRSGRRTAIPWHGRPLHRAGHRRSWPVGSESPAAPPGGSLHHEGLKLSHEQKEQIAVELGAGKAAVGVGAR